ncbi:MAG: hypothetical protein ACYDA2_05120 [Acidimicrobiales bacterium]
MSKRRKPTAKSEQSLAERLAPMTSSEIDKMSNRELAELMNASEQEVEAEPWTWREAAKAATDEFAERMVAALESGQAKIITDPTEIRQRLGGRPRVGGEAGEGPSTQVRVRVTDSTRAALEHLAVSQGRTISEVSREALDEYVARHAG